MTSTVTASPAIAAHSPIGPAPMRFMPAPTASTSAVMFSMLATRSATSSRPTIRVPQRPNRLRASSPRFWPVVRAVRSQISWTVAASGKLSIAVHSNPYWYRAPACE